MQLERQNTCNCWMGNYRGNESWTRYKNEMHI